MINDLVCNTSKCSSCLKVPSVWFLMSEKKGRNLPEEVENSKFQNFLLFVHSGYYVITKAACMFFSNASTFFPPSYSLLYSLVLFWKMAPQPNFTTVSNLTTPVPGGGGCPPVGIQLEGLIMPPVLIIDVILGLIGNLVALWIFWFKLKAWNPNTLFLFNLVIADFFALVSLPLRIDALLRGHWVFGDGMCRINLFLMFSNRSASIALMTVVAIYRYFKVRKTMDLFWEVKVYFCMGLPIGVSVKNDSFFYPQHHLLFSTFFFARLSSSN